MMVSQAASLCVEAIDVSYGKLQVLFGVSLEVGAGDVLTVLGTNGAGKSTLLRAIAGLMPSHGRVLLDDADISDWDTEKRVRNGLVLVEGGRAVFPSLTVEENLRAGGFSFGRDKHCLETRREEVLGLFPALRSRWSHKAGRLSGGERQMLALAKGLLLNARVLCIDELSLGLAPVVVDELLEVIRLLRSRNVTIVLVEQSVRSALAVADQAIFLEKGQIRFAGSAQELAEGDVLHAAFLGGMPS